VHVYGDCFRDVNVVGDDALEGAGGTRSVASSVHHDTTVALVGNEKVVGTVEAQAAGLVETSGTRTDYATNSKYIYIYIYIYNIRYTVSM